MRKHTKPRVSKDTTRAVSPNSGVVRYPTRAGSSLLSKNHKLDKPQYPTRDSLRVALDAIERAATPYVSHKRREEPSGKTVRDICTLIAAGVYPREAAVSCGVPPPTFKRWLSIESVRHEVDMASAQARVAAEARVALENPLAWLTKGPGRTKPDRDGWTDSTAVTGPDGGPQLTEQRVTLGVNDNLSAAQLRYLELALEAGSSEPRPPALVEGAAGEGRGSVSAPVAVRQDALADTGATDGAQGELAPPSDLRTSGSGECVPDPKPDN